MRQICFASLFMFFKIIGGRHSKEVARHGEIPQFEIPSVSRTEIHSPAVDNSLSTGGPIKQFNKRFFTNNGTTQHIENVTEISDNVDQEDIC